MFQLLWLIPAFPLLGFILLTLLHGASITRRVVAFIGVGTVGISAILTGVYSGRRIVHLDAFTPESWVETAIF